MGKEPLVSILMPAYNAEAFIGESITSILNQTYSNWELNIVNDGSKDQTFSIARSFESDSRIRVFTQENAGASAARNRAFEFSKGEFVKYFDADDLLNPEAIEAQIELALQNPDCVISGKWGRFYNNELSTFKLSWESVWENMTGVNWVIESWSKGPNMTQPGIFLLPRRLVETYGGWNESLSLVDDMEFFTRIILNSPIVYFCNQAILFYRSGLPNNLASSKTPLAMESAFKAIFLSTQNLLEKSNSISSKKAAANQFQSLAYNAYPKYPSIVKRSEEWVQKLGGSNYHFPGGFFRKMMARLIGWKATKKIHLVYESIRHIK